MRVSLEGHGDLIPETAFPAPGEDANVPSKSFLLEDGVPYEKAADVTDGFTHFEVWCVGAVGGHGGLYSTSYAGDIEISGGAGGGGGLHRVAGLLEDLPDSCPVVVGQAGEDGEDFTTLLPRELVNVDGSGDVIFPVTTDPNPDYVDPPSGTDGGASSFNGTTCRASGGKRGEPPVAEEFHDWYTVIHDAYADPANAGILFGAPMYWTTPPDYNYETIHRVMGGLGGEGGCGDQTTPGGGGAGASHHWDGIYNSHGTWGFETMGTRVIENAAKGSWDGSIGKGGGGGLGCVRHVAYESGHMVPPVFPLYVQLAAKGADGSFSFGNPSVFGPGQPGKLPTPSPIGWTDTNPILPGSGGGAKAHKTLKYGSRAPGFNPNGCVFIRLYKIS
jgi:hypothetical protein